MNILFHIYDPNDFFSRNEIKKLTKTSLLKRKRPMRINQAAVGSQNGPSKNSEKPGLSFRINL